MHGRRRGVAARPAAVALALIGTAGVVALLGGSASAGPRLPARGVHPAQSRPSTEASCLVGGQEHCFDPALMRRAYDLDPLYAKGITGKGVSVGIVDSFGSPTIRHDIAVYDAEYGLPALDLQIVTPAGTPPPFQGDNSDRVGWAGETTLDVEAVHTVAPGARIVLIETPTSETEGLAGFPDIMKAENAELSAGTVDVFSQSFAATEPTFASPAQVRTLAAEVYPRAQQLGVTVLSSSGDNGPTDDMLDEKTLYTRPVTSWPDSDPLVTAVGGTTLHVGPDGTKVAPDSAWGELPGAGAGGGGLSEVFTRPAFQNGVAAVVGTHRGVPDVSLDASPDTGLITYGSFDSSGWEVEGGTSQAAPLLAGIVALADQAARGRVGYLNDVLYADLAGKPGSGLIDVTSGSNALVDASGTANPVPGYSAVPGYDLATGLGTVDAAEFVPALVAATKGHTTPLSAARAVSGTSSVPPSTASPGAGNTIGGTTSSPAPARTAAPAGAGGSGHRTLLAVILAVAVLALLALVGGLVARSRRRGAR